MSFGNNTATPFHRFTFRQRPQSFAGQSFGDFYAGIIAKCRKKKGNVRKTAKGASLKRWKAEEWKDTKTGKACGAKTKGKQYCRPTKRVSSKTPKTKSQMSKSAVRKRQAQKSAGKRASVAKKRR